MENWTQTTLGEIVTNFDSKRVPVSSMQRAKRQGEFPYYGATGVMDYIDGWIFEGLRLLIGEDGSVRTTAGTPFLQLIDGRYWVNNHAHVLKGETDADTRFLYYYLSQVQITPFMSGSVQDKLSQGNMNRIPVLYPPKKERWAIASVLGSLDEQIEVLRRQNDTLERLAQTLFRAWFVDFEPVKAKQAGIAPACLDAQTAALFPADFEDGLPVGWKMGNLKELATLSRASVNPMLAPDETFNHYSLPAYDEGQWPKQEQGADIKSNKFLLAQDCVLVSKLNPHIKRIWFPCFPKTGRNVCSTEFLVLNSEVISAAHLYLLVSSPEFQSAFYGLVSGTSNSHQRVRPEDVFTIACVVPPAKIAEAFTEIVAPMTGKIAANGAQARTLAQIRDALLPRLLSGALRVPESLIFDEEGAVSMDGNAQGVLGF